MSVFKMILILFVTFIVGVHSQSTAARKCFHKEEIACDDGSCISELGWCDAFEDCLDGSDEIYCKGEIPCRPDIHFECDNKRCVPISAVCDEYDHCDDGSDEKNCRGYDLLENVSVVLPPSSRNFSSTNFTDVGSVDRALEYLLNMRSSDYGWGAFTPRAIVALSFTSKLSQIAEKNKQLMLKQLNIQILQDIMKHGNATLSNLALYINALYATCQDPSNFEGMNLITRLRSETDSAIKLNASIPLAFLTLCLSNETRPTDNYVLAEMYNSKVFGTRTGSRSLIILTMTCIMQKDKNGIFHHFVSNFFASETEKALDADIYTQALFIQASIAAGFPHSVELASKQLPDGSFGDLLSTYYSIPILLNSSLLDLVCKNQNQRLISKSDLYRPSGRNEVTYTLWISAGKDTISHSVKVNFDGKKSFFDVMTMAAAKDPLYRFLYEESDEGKRVYSIAGIPNDVESGTSWILYAGDADMKINSEQGLKEQDPDVEKIFPDDKNNFVFWLKRTLPTY